MALKQDSERDVQAARGHCVRGEGKLTSSQCQPSLWPLHILAPVRPTGLHLDPRVPHRRTAPSLSPGHFQSRTQQRSHARIMRSVQFEADIRGSLRGLCILKMPNMDPNARWCSHGGVRTSNMGPMDSIAALGCNHRGIRHIIFVRIE